MISFAVIAFQLVIFGSLVGVGKAFGKVAATLLAAFWVVWSLLLIATPKLMAIQLCTIGLGWMVGCGLAAEADSKKKLVT